MTELYFFSFHFLHLPWRRKSYFVADVEGQSGESDDPNASCREPSKVDRISPRRHRSHHLPRELLFQYQKLGCCWSSYDHSSSLNEVPKPFRPRLSLSRLSRDPFSFLCDRGRERGASRLCCVVHAPQLLLSCRCSRLSDCLTCPPRPTSQLEMDPLCFLSVGLRREAEERG